MSTDTEAGQTQIRPDQTKSRGLKRTGNSNDDNQAARYMESLVASGDFPRPGSDANTANPPRIAGWSDMRVCEGERERDLTLLLFFYSLDSYSAPSLL